MFERLWVQIQMPFTGWTWHFSHWFGVKNCIGCWKRPKIHEKEAGVDSLIFWHLFNFKIYACNILPMLISSTCQLILLLNCSKLLIDLEFGIPVTWRRPWCNKRKSWHKFPQTLMLEGVLGHCDTIWWDNQMKNEGYILRNVIYHLNYILIMLK